MSEQIIPLSLLISPEAIKVGVKVSNWEKAVDLVGDLLVKTGKTRPEYTQAMKRVLKEMGPYAVIAPGIVLLHARPEDGVLQPCLGIVILATPVPFGHSENDPVDLVLALGAIDKNAHVAALQQLARLLSDPIALKKIRAAQNEKELMEILSLQNGSTR
jgi:mannitol/fructose-specific phosphotransferase system IIA component (Ntr-type)